MPYSKVQHTAAAVSEKMNRIYDEHEHKHKKCPLTQERTPRKACCTRASNDSDLNGGTGHHRKYNLRKMMKRLDKGRFH